MAELIAAAGNPRMHRGEARETLERIRDGLRDCRLLLLQLYEREGWRALGYSSWRECCQVEFDLSIRHLYRLLAAAKVERDVTHGSHAAEVGPIPERQLRELTRLETAAMRREIFAEAQACEGGRARRLKDLVDQVIAIGGGNGAAGELAPEEFAREDRGGQPLPAGPATLAAKLRAKASALRALHPQLGERSRAADQALDHYLEIAVS